MADLVISRHVKVNNVLADADSPPVLRDPTNTFGFKKDVGNEIILPAGTPLPKLSTGIYALAVVDLVAGQGYTYWLETTVGGNTTTQVKHYIAPPVALSTPVQQMASGWMVVEPPENRVVSADQLRVQCRLGPESRGVWGTDDASLNEIIDAATEYAEARLDTSLSPRTLRAVFNAGNPIDIPRGPLIQVLEVCGKGQTPTTDYDIVNFGWTNRIVPRGNIQFPVFVNYRAGHVGINMTTPAVPKDIVQAIRMHAATMFENRASVTDTAKTPLPHSLEMFYATRCRNRGVG